MTQSENPFKNNNLMCVLCLTSLYRTTIFQVFTKTNSKTYPYNDDHKIDMSDMKNSENNFTSVTNIVRLVNVQPPEKRFCRYHLGHLIF